ncbi:MAG: hypothetical protein TQ35_0004780 [Candidatus Aramenus sulfurataquae]|jgi:hypothetical protein|uniref:Uncharacterized protein n=2 Tax=Candidatus Aramenus sulfurataquae TaxID=1326980 RepID=A0A0F2LME1_9CREN|nr:hypothetical protein [Candidatus Aramenus sulfurataquae]
MVGTLAGYVLSVKDLRLLERASKEEKREVKRKLRELEAMGTVPFLKGVKGGVVEIVAICRGMELEGVLCLDSLSLVGIRRP